MIMMKELVLEQRMMKKRINQTINKLEKHVKSITYILLKLLSRKALIRSLEIKNYIVPYKKKASILQFIKGKLKVSTLFTKQDVLDIINLNDAIIMDLYLKLKEIVLIRIPIDELTVFFKEKGKAFIGKKKDVVIHITNFYELDDESWDRLLEISTEEEIYCRVCHEIIPEERKKNHPINKRNILTCNPTHHRKYTFSKRDIDYPKVVKPTKM